MDHSSQRIVSLIVGSIVNKTTYRTVYDEHAKKHFSFGARIQDDRLRVYERESHVDIVGELKGEHYALYNYTTHKHISLEIHEHHFTGYDFASSRHFQGEIHGSTIALFDHDKSVRAHYALS